MFNLKETIRRYKRVLCIARKPSRYEFTASSKVCALGIVIIGLIGFLIFMVFVLLGI